MSRPGFRSSRWIAAFSLAAALSQPAGAQSADDLAKARVTFQQGLSLEAAEDWAAALDKFQDVAKVKLTAQVRFHVARCKEKLGRLTEALGDYRLAEYDATQANAKEADEIAAAREALESRVPKLQVSRPGGAKVKVTLDGVEIGEAKLGKDVTIDPGEHVVVARWKGGKKTQQKFVIAEGETKKIALEAPAGGDDDDDDAPADDGEGEAEPAASAATTAPPPDSSGASPLPWIVGGVGVAALAAGAVFLKMRGDAEAELTDTCKPAGGQSNVCPERLKSRQDDGEKYSLFANVSLGLGLVGVGTAVVLFATQGGPAAPAPAPTEPAADSEARHRVRVHVLAGGPTTGLAVTGSF